jgi:hypothetical protein
MKAEVVTLSMERSGGPGLRNAESGKDIAPVKRMAVTCQPVEGETDLRQLSFVVDFTPDNARRYAFGNIIEVEA